jgi:hypothetical protein
MLARISLGDRGRHTHFLVPFCQFAAPDFEDLRPDVWGAARLPVGECDENDSVFKSDFRALFDEDRRWSCVRHLSSGLALYAGSLSAASYVRKLYISIAWRVFSGLAA